ncbi:MAG TPA: hypothetical protein VN684_12710 [Terriglobales bacterium]|nr:hypothetical protein [Terriglobales bacterium]
MKQIKCILFAAIFATLILPAAAQTTTNSGSMNSNTPPRTIHQRKQNQQDRIAQGVKSGQLTPRETAHLENHEARINREIHRDRAANGGKLTAREKARVNRQQNRESRRIYRDKHNGRRA